MLKQKKTLRNKLIYTSYISILSSIILISVISYISLSISSKKHALRTSYEITRQKSENISMRMGVLETALRDIIYNSGLQKSIGEYNNEKEVNLYHIKTSINKAISGVTNSLDVFDNIVIFSVSGDMIGNMQEFEVGRKADTYNWYKDLLLSEGDTYWLNNEIREVYDNYGSHFGLTGVKKIRSIEGITNIGKDLGYLFASVNLDRALGHFENEFANQKRQILIVDETSSKIIGGNDMEKTGQLSELNFLSQKENNQYIRYEGKEYLLSYEKIDSNSLSWYVVCMTLKDDILKDANFAIRICVFVSMILIIVFFVISINNANLISHPIKFLENQFEIVEKGNFDVRVKPRTNIIEIDNLFARFNMMVSRLNALIHEVYEAKIKEQKLLLNVKQTEIQALQMQINPHFLYNTLDSINWMALMGKNEEVSKMTIALGRLFRANMNIKGIYITVKEAIDNIELFIYLQHIRFGDKLSYEIKVEGIEMETLMLKYLLQPLVENSIKYGIEKYDIKDKISLIIYKESDHLVIDVIDDGKGIEEERLEEIKKEWINIKDAEEPGQHVEKWVEGGIGLSNIMKRLYLCYGKDASFDIVSNIGKGTKITIKFPICFSTNTNANK